MQWRSSLTHSLFPPLSLSFYLSNRHSHKHSHNCELKHTRIQFSLFHWHIESLSLWLPLNRQIVFKQKYCPVLNVKYTFQRDIIPNSQTPSFTNRFRNSLTQSPITLLLSRKRRFTHMCPHSVPLTCNDLISKSDQFIWYIINLVLSSQTHISP